MLVARYKEPRSWDDCPGFDLAPYKVSADRTAIGLRYQTMVTGGTIVVMVLYVRTQATFEPVFTRTVEYSAMESSDWSSAVIQVVPRKAAHNDLLVVESGGATTMRERWA